MHPLLSGALAAHHGWLLAALWALAGASLYWAVRSWRLAHAVADTARARVRSAPRGYVELYGRARCAQDRQSWSAPLTGRTCVWWSYRIEQRGSRGWHSVDAATSDATFLLHDDTGCCQIDPRGALVTPSERQVWYGSESWPSAPFSTGLGVLGSSYRYIEQRIHEFDGVCALGELAALGGVAGGDADLEVSALLHDWKSNPTTLLERFDHDGDGQLNAQEWEQARRAARAEVLTRQANEPVIKVMARPADSRPYILAARDPRRLAQIYRWQAAASVVGFFVAVMLLEIG